MGVITCACPGERKREAEGGGAIEWEKRLGSFLAKYVEILSKTGTTATFPPRGVRKKNSSRRGVQTPERRELSQKGEGGGIKGADHGSRRVFKKGNWKKEEGVAIRKRREGKGKSRG